MKCPICGEDNSEYAYECLKCSFSLRKRPLRITLWLKIIAAIIILAVVAYFFVPVLTDRASLYYWRIEGDKLFTEANYLKAAEAYSEAIKFDSDNTHFYAQRAACYAQIKEYEKAEQDYTKAIALDPGNRNYYYQRGMTNIELGQKGKARKDLEIALKLGVQEAQALLLQLDTGGDPVKGQ